LNNTCIFLGISAIMATFILDRFFRKIAGLFNPLQQRLQEMLSDVSSENKKSSDTADFLKLMLGALAGGSFGWLVTWDSPSQFVMLFFALIGFGLAFFIKRNVEESDHIQKLSEIVMIYETVSFFTKAGYSTQQSLQMSLPVTSVLAPALKRCLAAWPHGPARALEAFAQEAEVEEAELLSSVLLYIEEAGIQFGEAAAQEEARNLDALRESLSELAIVSKPLYYSVYRVLPLAAIGGVIIGPLLYKIITIMSDVIHFM